MSIDGETKAQRLTVIHQGAPSRKGQSRVEKSDFSKYTTSLKHWKGGTLGQKEDKLPRTSEGSRETSKAHLRTCCD